VDVNGRLSVSLERLLNEDRASRAGLWGRLDDDPVLQALAQSRFQNKAVGCLRLARNQHQRTCDEHSAKSWHLRSPSVWQSVSPMIAREALARGRTQISPHSAAAQAPQKSEAPERSSCSRWLGAYDLN
jgi:hypothetical protein